MSLMQSKKLFRVFISLLVFLSANVMVQAQTASEPSAFEREVLSEINLARSNPPAYASHLMAMRENYKSRMTFEGIKALDEAIVALKGSTALAPLEWSDLLRKPAVDHALDMAKTGEFSHTGSGNSTPKQRIERYGNIKGGYGETLNPQKGTPREVVIFWLIDDGVLNRMHREVLLDKDYKQGAVAMVDDSKTGFYCVFLGVGNILAKNDTPPVSTSAKTEPTTATTTTRSMTPATTTTTTTGAKTPATTTNKKPVTVTKKPATSKPKPKPKSKTKSNP